MKRLLFCCFSILLHIYTNSQVSEFLDIDAKKEFAGIPFLSPPDYSRLSFKNLSKGGNIYTLTGGVQFKTESFTLSEINVIVRKGRVMNFSFPIKEETEYAKILQALTGTFNTQTDIKESKVFHGANILFVLSKEKSTNDLFLATKDIDTVPDVTDNSGIINLLGKKITDPAVTQFISSIPGKNEKKEYENDMDITWPGEGITIGFSGKGEEAAFSYIIVYFMKDNYYWRNKPFKGSIKLPYDITASTSVLRLSDMFGEADGGLNISWREKNYKKFKLFCNYGDPVKQNNSDLLNHITIK